MRTTAEREYQRLLFSPSELRGFIDEAVDLFQTSNAVVTTSIGASFADKSGQFANLDALLTEPHLPDTLYDFELSFYLTSYTSDARDRINSSLTKSLRLRRSYPNVYLSVDAEDDPVWAYGVAEVLDRRLKPIADSARARSLGIPGKLVWWLNQTAARGRPYFFSGIGGLLLGALWFGGWKSALALIALLVVLAWFFGLIALLWFSIPKPTAWRSDFPMLALIVRSPVGQSQPDVAVQTLRWTRANVLVAIGVAMLLIVSTFAGAYYSVFLIEHWTASHR
jgi:hypothetical protein